MHSTSLHARLGGRHARLFLLTTVALFAAGVSAPAAFGVAHLEVPNSGDTIFFQGTNGDETMEVSAGSGNIVFSDTVEIFVSNLGPSRAVCSPDEGSTVVTCARTDVPNGVDISALSIAGGNTVGVGPHFSGNDTLTIGASVPADLPASIAGADGNDNLTGGAANDVIDGDRGGSGPDGIDVINGGGGADQLRGAFFPGNPNEDNRYTFNDGGNAINGGSGDDIIDGAGDTDFIEGDTGDDVLKGGAGNDVISGDRGDDFMGESSVSSAGLGADTYNGGEGSEDDGGDRVGYTFRAIGINADIGGGANDGNSTNDGPVGARDNIGTDVENLRGGEGADNLTGDSEANVLEGNGGTDVLAGSAGTGADGADTFHGGANNAGFGDTVTYATREDPITAGIGATGTDGDAVSSDIENLTGGSGGDNLAGDDDVNVLRGGPGTGNDALFGLGEDDTFFGGTGGTTGSTDGADTFTAGNQSVSGPGDTVSYAGRTDPITARIGATGTDGDVVGSEVDNLTGGTGNDTLTGDVDRNTLTGSSGDDTLAGGFGTGADGADVLLGGSHNTAGDTVTYFKRQGAITAAIGLATGTDTDTVGSDVENLTGGEAGDTLTGDDDANALRGGPGTGNDSLNGLGGDDISFGGTGVNTGPDGADTFIAGNSLVLGDTVSYAGRTDPITASIADDGPADADGDVVPRQFDNLTGGDGGDNLTGDIDPNYLRGGLGDDHLDVTRGGLPDTADCGDGIDTALGDSAASDTMINCETTTFEGSDAAPTAVNDSTTVATDSGANAVNVLANDTDPDGGTKLIQSFTDPANGTVAITGGGTGLTYTPDAGYCNEPDAAPEDTFTYSLNGGSSATVFVTVSCGTVPAAGLDVVAPNTALGSAKITRSKRKAKFSFSSNEPGSTFLCKIDKKAFASCTSPKTYKKLKRGKHKFQVQARDAAGNLDGSPAVKKFKI